MWVGHSLIECHSQNPRGSRKKEFKMARTHEYDELECLCRTCDRCDHLTADGECDLDLDIEEDEIPDEFEEEIVIEDIINPDTDPLVSNLNREVE